MFELLSTIAFWFAVYTGVVGVLYFGATGLILWYYN